ncbi:putative SERF-like protein [Agrilus planipennis]|uniref:SERF-like protein n=1 Tax=Agrilus planipennis TaxID=224129 RepID=A0A7F5RBC6_AGRPL|nr:putative SERF-like protein [Agrilus planipennis]
MTRGNQRELAREKNMKKQQEIAKKKGKGGEGLTLEQRKYRDAEKMREKQKMNELKKNQKAK